MNAMWRGSLSRGRVISRRSTPFASEKRQNFWFVMIAPRRKYQCNSAFLQLRVMRRDCSAREMLAPKAAREEKEEERGGGGEEKKKNSFCAIRRWQGF